MPRTITLPHLHPGMEENVLVDWLKQEGDLVRYGEPLYIVETRKGVFEMPSELDGRVDRLLVPRGASVTPGQAIAIIEPLP